MLRGGTEMSTVNTRLSSNSLSSGSKYGGLLKQKVQKRLRNQIFSVLSHVDAIVPSYFPMHEVISVIRMIQILLPCLFAQYTSVWEPGKLGAKCVSILSVFYVLLPPEYHNSYGMYFEIIYDILTFIFFTTVIISALIFAKYAKIPTYVAYYICIYGGTIFLILTPIAMCFCCETLVRIGLKLPIANSITAESVVIAFNIGLSLLVFQYFKDMSSISLVFRPLSLLTVLQAPQLLTALFIVGLNIVAAIGSQMEALGRFICFALMICIYVFGVFITLWPGSFIKSWHSNVFMAICLTGAVHTTVILIMNIMGVYATEVNFFEIVGEMIIFTILSSIINNLLAHKYMNVLDKFMEMRDGDSIFHSEGFFVKVVCTGMKFAHPACLDWSVFKYAVDRWSTSVRVWALFGKFVAIYPSEDNLLSYVQMSMISKKLKGAVAKQTISQAQVIMTQRETTLSPQLKNKLNKLSKQVNHAKQKLRRIWDLVIQGNIAEMELGAGQCYDYIKKANVEFNHVISMYPNNRFVSRTYSRFLYEVMGDHKGYLDWSEKTRLMMRGIIVNIDRTNALGIHAFPALPPSLASTSKLSTGIESESVTSMTDVGELDEEQLLNIAENLNHINQQIDGLTIPGIRNMIIFTILIVLIFIAAPIIAMLVYGSMYIDQMDQPLTLTYYLSLARTLNFMAPLFAYHYVLESLPVGNPVLPKPQLDFLPEALGSTDDTRNQTKYLVGECVITVQDLSQFTNFLVSDPELLKVNAIIFGDKDNKYDYYINRFVVQESTQSFQTALMDVIHFTSELLDENLTIEVVNDTRLLTPYLNAHPMSQYVSQALEYAQNYIVSYDEKAKKIVMIAQSSVSVFYFILILATVILTVRQVENNKIEMYKCLTALPKNVVSQMSEALRMIKKEENSFSRSTEINSEVNKQEENVIKVFNAESDIATVNVDKVIVVLCFTVFLICSLAGFDVAVTLFSTVTSNLKKNSPHMNNLLGTCGYMAAVLLAFDDIMGIKSGVPCGNFTYLDLAERAEERLAYLIYYYQNARYGRPDKGQPPFGGIKNNIDPRFGCTNESKLSTDIRDSYRCFTPDEQVFLYEAFTIKYLQLIEYINKLTTDSVLDPKDPLFNEMWVMSVINLYDLYFIPLFNNLIKEMNDVLKQALPNVAKVSIVMVLIAIIAEIILINQIVIVSKKFKFTLSLLLHAPPQVIMQTPKIMEVLSGNFRDTSKDVTQRKDEFYDDLAMSIPDSIIIANPTSQIIFVNRASERIYNTKAEDIMGKDIKEFFSSSNFGNNSSSIFMNNSQQVLSTYQSNDSISYILLSSSPIGNNTIVTCRDNTQTVTYNNLIEEEKAKSDRLLGSILPTSLVRRVQSGEKNISFAVQSATITFIDIVEFTPWCGSHEPTFIMSTLNNLFKEFDQCVASYSTMTKIKCIGDCYMAAGGIFSEINQPGVHSREVVDFGLDAIESISRINTRLGTELRVRVGINTGGPIVAGVLGTEKPTFEILGPAINMAQQMEHHGVPMSVHISRPVYELVYGSNFIIKERGEVEIKSGSVLTYLVSGRRK